MTYCYHRPHQRRTFQGNLVCQCWLTAAAEIVGYLLTGRLPA